MKLSLFSNKSYDQDSFTSANEDSRHELEFIDTQLNLASVEQANGKSAICVFVNDQVDASVLRKLYAQGTRLICLRCAGYNNVDIAEANKLGIKVVNVPAYSPHAVAEHALALILALNRHIPQAYERVHSGNFTLDGLIGFDLNGKTAGIIGTGRIGAIVACTLQSLGIKVLATDPIQNPQCCHQGIEYADLDTILSRSDIISLHCSLTAETCNLIGHDEISKMKPGVMLINTSRGASVNTEAAIEGLESGQIGYLGIDVYEHEQSIFLNAKSKEDYKDALLDKLISLPNVIVTPHQAFFTTEALHNIAVTTLNSLTEFEQGSELSHLL